MLKPETAPGMTDVSVDADMTEAADAVATLHTRTVDAQQGYVTMVKKAEPEFRPVAQRFHDLHARHATALAGILTSLGREVDEDGSFMGTVNQAVVSIRAMFDEIDEDVMDRVRSGEEHVLKAFDVALHTPLAAAHLSAISQMRDDLAALLEETRHLS